MKGQQYIRFPKEVTRFLTGDYDSAEDIVLPLFKELSPEEEISFRWHARENYHVGDLINGDIFHPVWCDEARKMNTEWLETGCRDWCCDPGNSKRPRDECNCRCCVTLRVRIKEGVEVDR